MVILTPSTEGAAKDEFTLKIILWNVEKSQDIRIGQIVQVTGLLTQGEAGLELHVTEPEGYHPQASLTKKRKNRQLAKF